MSKLTVRTIVASASLALAAGLAGAFIALAVDDGDTTIIQQPPAAAVATGGAAAPAPILESPPMIRISGPVDAAYPMRIFEQVALSVVLVQTPTGAGSGFFVDTQGHLVTNYHVVQGNDEVLIALGDGSRVRGEVLGASPANDLAVVKIDPTGLRIVPVQLGDSDALVVGDYKTDRVATGSLIGHSRGYAAQGAVYQRAVRDAFRLSYLPRFELWYLRRGEIVAL